jgi:hypothetical protein
MTISGRRKVIGLLWAAVGLLLVWRGLPYTGLRAVPAVRGLAGSSRWLALALGALLGVAKGLTALRRSARSVVHGITARGEEAPAWSVLSPFMVLLIATMVGLGLMLRLAPYDPLVKAWAVGVLYPAIGTALILGGYLVVSLPIRPPER